MRPWIELAPEARDLFLVIQLVPLERFVDGPANQVHALVAPIERDRQSDGETDGGLENVHPERFEVLAERHRGVVEQVSRTRHGRGPSSLVSARGFLRPRL